nr:hypothetical protein [Pseudomonas sp. YL2]
MYQITYGGGKPQECPSLFERIKGYGTWCQAMDSTWIIVTQETAVQIRDKLRDVMEREDGLLVTRLHGEAAWKGLPTEVTQWLKT